MENDEVFYSFYDTLFAGKDYLGEVKFLLELVAAKDKPLRILEIGSGTGNHTMTCAGLGHNVVGVDTDHRMVAIAETKRKSASRAIASRIRYFNGSVENLQVADFDLAISMFNVVNYLTSINALKTFMSGVAQRLMSQAPFVFDMWNGVAAVRELPRDETRHMETQNHDIHLAIRSETDLMALKTNLYYTLEITEKATGLRQNADYSMCQTLWPPKVIRDMAEAAGFNVEAIYPHLTFERPAADNDWKVLFLCRRI
jgi:SAM-dependent methyltransferase